MLRDSSDRRRQIGRSLAFILMASVVLSGCGDDIPAGSTTPPPKEALKRQNEMFNFMKEQGKVKAPKDSKASKTSQAP
jgi:hypothetical protein